jgi:hypothetical protein
MSDDGTGKDITIPGLLISVVDGNIIKEFWKKYKDDKATLSKITLDINFEIVCLFCKHKERKEVVDLKVFYSSEITEVYEMVEELHHYVSKLGTKVGFQPYYVMKESDFYDEDNRKSVWNCVSGGQFCASKNKELNITDPIFIINENIRQKCIYKIYDTEKYFKYMESFHHNCMNKSKGLNFNNNCSEIVYSQLSFDSEKIRDCLFTSFLGNYNQLPLDYSNYKITNNTLLQDDANVRKVVGAFLVPSVMINGWRFSVRLKIY